MSISMRALTLCGLAASFLPFGQAQTTDDFVTVPGLPSYVGAAPVDASQIDPTQDLSGMILSMPPNSTDSSAIFMNPALGRSSPNSAAQNSAAPSTSSSNPGDDGNSDPNGTIPGLIAATTFNGAFAAQGGPAHGQVFRYTMLGNHPRAGGTTTIPTKIDEISWILLNADGSVFKTVSFAPFDDLTLDSPNFVDSTYTSSPSPTQFADAVQRAEFFKAGGEQEDAWHTRLEPKVINRVSIKVPRFVSVRVSPTSVIQARTYFTKTAADGNTAVLMLNLAFIALWGNESVQQIIHNNFQTNAVNVTAFPNTFLFSLNLANPNTPGPCCVLGFHTYFFEPALVPEPRYLDIFESWISPGLFHGGVQDVTALSHEISEAFNDPFGDNIVFPWQFPLQPPTSTVCQGNLETGDPLEVFPNSTFPVTLGNFTYHPQNEALLQWFEMGTASNAIDGAFSYPNETLLTHSAVPCP